MPGAGVSIGAGVAALADGPFQTDVRRFSSSMSPATIRNPQPIGTFGTRASAAASCSGSNSTSGRRSFR